MKRGEVYWADLAPRSGSAQQGRRPVIKSWKHMAGPSTNLKLLVGAIDSRSPVSLHYNKTGKTPGLRIGNSHAAFILRRKDGTESIKVDIVQTAGVSDTDPPAFPEWRRFDLADISKVVVRKEERPFRIDPRYKPAAAPYRFAIAQV